MMDGMHPTHVDHPTPPVMRLLVAGVVLAGLAVAVPVAVTVAAAVDLARAVRRGAQLAEAAR